MAELKAFNRWSTEGLVVKDQGLQQYLTLQPKIVPKTGARYSGKKFHKSHIFIVERLANKLMVVGHKGRKHFISSGHNCGKKELALGIVRKTFEKIEQRVKGNPLEVFVGALENAAPREETITIEYGGARYPKAVDVSPQRRIDLALRSMTQGAYQRSFNKKITIEDALADEIVNAFYSNQKSNAITKKRDLERQASSSK